MSTPQQFTRPDGRPLPPDHHLSKNPRGKYVIRANVSQGDKFIGRRITVQTGTDDLEVARRIRDAVVIAWIKAGNLTRDITIDFDEEM